MVMLRRGGGRRSRSRRRRGRNDIRHLALPLPSICASVARRYNSPYWGRSARRGVGVAQDCSSETWRPIAPPEAGENPRTAAELGFGMPGRRGGHWRRREVFAKFASLGCYSPRLLRSRRHHIPACGFRFSVSRVLLRRRGERVRTCEWARAGADHSLVHGPVFVCWTQLSVRSGK